MRHRVATAFVYDEKPIPLPPVSLTELSTIRASAKWPMIPDPPVRETTLRAISGAASNSPTLMLPIHIPRQVPAVTSITLSRYLFPSFPTPTTAALAVPTLRIVFPLNVTSLHCTKAMADEAMLLPSKERFSIETFVQR